MLRPGIVVGSKCLLTLAASLELGGATLASEGCELLLSMMAARAPDAPMALVVRSPDLSWSALWKKSWSVGLLADIYLISLLNVKVLVLRGLKSFKLFFCRAPCSSGRS